MPNAQRTAAIKITKAAARPRTMEELSKAGVVPGEFGLTQRGAQKLIWSMVAVGELAIQYDALNLPTFKAV